MLRVIDVVENWAIRNDTALRNRSLPRLWARDYQRYCAMIEAGFVQDSVTGGWKYYGLDFNEGLKIAQQWGYVPIGGT
jgi:hypothetical protein